MAADFQNVYHYNVLFLLVGRVGGHFRRQLRPCRWKRIKFYGRYLFFSFTCVIRAFSVLSPELHRGKKLWTLIADFPDEMWMLKQPNRWNCRRLLQKNNNFSSRPIKPLARQEVQPPCFLLICTQTPAYWHPKLWIKWNGSFYFVSFVEKRCSSFCPENTTENSKRS